MDGLTVICLTLAVISSSGHTLSKQQQTVVQCSLAWVQSQSASTMRSVLRDLFLLRITILSPMSKETFLSIRCPLGHPWTCRDSGWPVPTGGRVDPSCQGEHHWLRGVLRPRIAERYACGDDKPGEPSARKMWNNIYAGSPFTGLGNQRGSQMNELVYCFNETFREK